MKGKFLHISVIAIWLLLLSPFLVNESLCAVITTQSQENVSVELVGYNGLQKIALAKQTVSPDKKATIETTYSGLALLTIAGRGSYPILIGDDSLTLKIEDAPRPPSFIGSKANTYFYELLAGKKPDSNDAEDGFAQLMFQAKQLLESTHSVRIIEDLQEKKKEFYTFVSDNYSKLKNSDMVRRLISQSFMMLEYVDYHVEGEPATKIKERYLQNVVSMTDGWLKALKTHIPENEVLNYIVGLYYDRSMVFYASVIMNNFPRQAYCPGEEPKELKLPDKMQITREDVTIEISLSTVQGEKTFSFVSSDCPVSMVAAVSKARRLAQQNESASLIVVPVEKLSEKHLSLQRLLSHNNMYFVDDEAWRQENLPEEIRLPYTKTIH